MPHMNAGPYRLQGMSASFHIKIAFLYLCSSGALHSRFETSVCGHWLYLFPSCIQKQVFYPPENAMKNFPVSSAPEYTTPPRPDRRSTGIPQKMIYPVKKNFMARPRFCNIPANQAFRLPYVYHCAARSSPDVFFSFPEIHKMPSFPPIQLTPVVCLVLMSRYHSIRGFTTFKI